VLWVELAILAAFCGFLFFFGVGAFGLVGADEPRYAQIAREMLARHDWVTPLLHGKPWLEKPVLYYWEAMVAYSVIGVSDWAARLPPAFSATAMVAAIYFFARRFVAAPLPSSGIDLAPAAEVGAEGNARKPGRLAERQSSVALDAALITASSAAVVAFAHGASTDMPMAANFTIAMLGWFAWLRSGHKAWLAAFYIFLALATLAKGPVAPVLAGIMVVGFALIRRDARLLLRTLWLPGVALFLAVSVPWYWAVEASTHQFFRVFLLEHNLERFSTNRYQHPQPFWFYVPVLLLSLAPWTVYGAAAFVRALRPGKTEVVGSADSAADVPGRAARRMDDLTLFLVIWAVVPVVLFSFSKSKLPGYILPAVPAWTLLLARTLSNWSAAWMGRNGRPKLGLLVPHGLISAALMYAVVVLPYSMLRVPPPRLAQGLAAATATVVFLVVVLTVWRQGLRTLRFVTLVPVLLAFAFVVRIAGPSVDARQSARPIARELSGIGAQKTALAVFHAPRSVEYGLGFYQDREIASYDRGEIPTGEHLVVAPQGSGDLVRLQVGDRRVVRVGGFVPQRLEFFWVAGK
jgi:4-amino-4-deoxy-L-arabinose transferase-like glycosyltransferase